MPILGDFAAKYGSFADELGVPMDDLYQALVDSAENTVRYPPLTVIESRPKQQSHSRLIGTWVCLSLLKRLPFLMLGAPVGRQNTAWKTFGFIPTGWTDPSGSTGLPTREASRALEV